MVLMPLSTIEALGASLLTEVGGASLSSTSTTNPRHHMRQIRLQQHLEQR